MAKVLKWLGYAAIGIGSMLMFMASIGPDEATSKLAQWVSWLGLDGAASSLNNAATDQWGFFIGSALLAISLISMTVVATRRWSIGTADPSDTRKLTLRQAAEYIANDAAITVPNKKIPLAHFPLPFAALHLQDAAKIGSITVLARERGQGSFKKIDPEAWEIIEFDWATLLGSSRNDLMSETAPVKLPDTPKVPDIVDLRFFKDEIKKAFPRQTLLEKWSRKRFRKKHGTR